MDMDSTAPSEGTAPDHQWPDVGVPSETLPIWLVVTIISAALTSVVAGIIYWAVKGWMFGVVLSFILPGFGALSIGVSLLA